MINELNLPEKMTENSKIKNIIFDLGGVLIDIDFFDPFKQFEQLGWREEVNFDQLIQHDNFKDFEIGKISAAQFRDFVRSLIKVQINDDDINRIWNSMLKTFRKEAIHTIKSIQNNYNLFLYSNTNEIHQIHFENRFIDEFGYSLHDLFNQVYYSHEIRQRKPASEGFHQILNENGLNAQETLFLDDLRENLSAAEKLGIQTNLVTPEYGVDKILL
ncbi:HAD family phosphatase [Puteibacter caeruleilacunae]|nr:HAD family phosphatase [Puteibacter caeruleilacunae]